MPSDYQAWGRIGYNNYTRIVTPYHHAVSLELNETCLAFGNGRSYGDVAYVKDGVLIDNCELKRFISFDREQGILVAEAGVQLQQILNLIVPCGWFLAVTPGTQFITLGGALANDVHGKNHHMVGSFGNFVIEFELARSSGERLICSRVQNSDYFYATLGGLGLTGWITWVKIKLLQVQNPYLVVHAKRFANLTEYFALNEQLEPQNTYTVAWVDCLAKGSELGRGIYYCADHAGMQQELPNYTQQSKNYPFKQSFSLINKLSLRLFNSCYYNQALHDGIQHYQPFFYPLDKIANWNRIYGSKGFYQYQCVVPKDVAPSAMHEIFNVIQHSGRGSFLAVLKTFGDKHSGGMLSFPRPGVTLALDFPNHGAKILELFTRLDRIVYAAAGAIYPAKDCRMSEEMFKNSYPRWQEFLQFKDEQFNSVLWDRVMGNEP